MVGVWSVVALVGIGIAVFTLVQTNETPTVSGPSISINVPQTITTLPGIGQTEQEGFRVMRAFGKEGTGPGHFEDGRALALDPEGFLYVAEYSGGRIQRFDTTGKFLTQWIGNPDMPLPAMAVGRDGVVYVLQRGNIERYKGATGEKLSTFKTGYYGDIFPMLDGGLLALQGHGRSQHIIRFDAQGREKLRIPIEANNVSLAADGLGYIYALGQFQERGSFQQAVFKYDPEGNFLTRFGSDGDEPGQFRAPHAITVDGQGRVFVSDIRGLQVYGSDGRYIKTLRAGPSIFGMAFDDAGALYVMERNSNLVKRLEIEWP
jgi:hypothetical protein